MALPAAILEFTPADAWRHAERDDLRGFRVVSSIDQPDTVVLQVTADRTTVSVRLGKRELAELNAQASAQPARSTEPHTATPDRERPVPHQALPAAAAKAQ